MNKSQLAGTILFACVMFPLTICAQGDFRNLDFESARYPLVPDSNQQVPLTNALPGWTTYIGGTSYDKVLYNSINLGAPAVSFHDAGDIHQVPFHGLGSVYLQASFRGNPPTSAAIGQTGLIPADAQSLTFYGNILAIDLTLGGEPIPTFNLGPAPSGYYTYVGDISTFAGQTTELRITVPSGGGNLDFIQFSTTPVPEPSTWALLALGSAAFWHAARRRSK